MAQFWAQLEGRVDEAVGRAVNLALGERPQFDSFHAARERVGQIPKSKQTRRSRQQEPAGPWIVVDIRLNGQQEFWDSLDLIDYRQAAEGDEPYGILEGRLPVLGEI